jgi:UDP-galactopyranose mutase
MKIDYLIVGSGLTGATIARYLRDAGREVLVLERRNHLGGNVHDHFHPSGIRIHTYGPHYFRTNSEELWTFVNRFDSFYKYEAVLKTIVDGYYENWPIAGSYISRIAGEHWIPEFTGNITNFEEASLAMMPRVIYEKFVKGYTEKQWGVPAHALSAGLAKRFDVRLDDEPRLTRHEYQGIPERGYAVLMHNLLSGIPVLLNVDYLRYRDQFHAQKKLIYTGPIDELFGFDLGRLAYRGQKREHRYLAGEGFLLPCGQVNNPGQPEGSHIRTLEWKHMLPREYASRLCGTVITKETTVSPSAPDHYEYPFPDEANMRLYQMYRDRVETIPNLVVCGRLGEYRYFDMDQAMEHAVAVAKQLINTN